MNRNQKRAVIISTCSVCIILLFGLASFFSHYLFSEVGDIYETNDIADYGNIVGNYDNETPREFIFSFFPETIESYFEQPQYHYKAIKGDSYAYEICLEFFIKDQQTFDNYVQVLSAGKEAVSFVYDQKYTDYTISNEYHGQGPSSGNEIANAGLGKVLVDKEAHQIIYIAVGTYDGGYATIDDLNYYWTRFASGQGDGSVVPSDEP